MKRALLHLVGLAAVAAAQPPGRNSLVALLGSDLMPLSSMKDSPDSPERERVMERFATDIKSRHPQGFVTRKLAYTLTGALIGKSLSDEKVRPLASGIVDSFDEAFLCRASSCNLLESVPFRAAIEKTNASLTALGVSSPDAQECCA